MSPIVNFKNRVLILALLFCLPLSAQETEVGSHQTDSTLNAYYQRCLENSASPVVLQMADTLFRMSVQRGDQRMQVTALMTSLDYYYYKGMEDSIIVCTNRVKDFAKKTHQPRFYYFAWGSRLIHFYINSGRINTAFYEAENMRKEAQQSDNKEGLSNCYNVLSTIYTLKKMDKQAFESRLKEVELIETYKLSQYNLVNAYTEIANYYIREGQLGQALKTLKKADAAITSSSHEVICSLAYMNYYLANRQTEMAEARLKEAIRKVNEEQKLYPLKKQVFEAEYVFFKYTQQYNRGLIALDSLYIEHQKMGERAMNQMICRNKGELLYTMGKEKEAAPYLAQYIQIKDSTDAVHEQDAATEFATLLGLEKLNVEQQDLRLKSQNEHIENTRILILLLIAFLIIVFAFLYREHHLNSRLIASENQLRQRNEDLTASKEALRIAKEDAEKASRMKTLFIQSMTHEIRTPLNAIVGFSQILTSMFDEKGGTQEFTDTIEENTKKLLKLIDDVLDLTDQETNQSVEITDTEIYKCCAQSLDRVRQHVHKGVELHFRPSNETLLFPSNDTRLEQILFNLLHNAARATLKGSITLAYYLSRDKKALIMTITDTGIGIPEDKHEAVFERFVKLDDFSQGFGLGLSLCRTLVEKMNGTLVIDSSHTEGCRFVLTFPALQS